MASKLRVIELFAGIGACSKALENLSIEHEIVDAVEIDKFAIKAFNAIHGTNFEPQDITKWDKDIGCDLIMHGSPCQDFSVAGKQAGGDAGSGTRSSLMYETLRIVEKLKPKYVIWENVKNLLSKKHRHNFDAYLEAMKQLGYKNYYQVLNAKNYGVPQNRERVFTVSIRLDIPYSTLFRFPDPIPLEKKLEGVLENNVDEKYYLTAEQIEKIKFSSFSQARQKIVEPFIVASRGRGEKNDQHLEPRKDGLTNTLTSVQKDNYVAIRTANSKGYDMAVDGDGIDLAYPKSSTRRGRVGQGISKTLPTSDSQGVLDGLKIRKLTPREHYRLMAFDDASFDRASRVISNSQLYKTAGNSIVVNVLEAILKEMLK